MNTKKTLIIYDWDDTLFPTHWLTSNNLSITDLGNVYKPHAEQLDIALANLLQTSLKYGTVIIVTNASSDWIYLSKSVLKHTSQIIDKYIKIFSARELYDKRDIIMNWKINTFQNNLNDYLRWTDNVLSIGDALFEYNALVSLRNHTKKHNLKTIKLQDNPTFGILYDQLEVLNDSMNDICDKNSHLDLNFTFF